MPRVRAANGRCCLPTRSQKASCCATCAPSDSTSDSGFAKGCCRFTRRGPTLQGLEQHLITMYDHVRQFRPSVVVVDPISNLTMEPEDVSLKPTLMRLIDFLKQEGITAVFTSLTTDTTVPSADSEVGVSSLMDTWFVLGNYEQSGERTRTLQVLKSRGMEHSNQVREFLLSRRGIELIDVYLSGARALTGTARVTQQAEELAAIRIRELDHNRILRDLGSQRAEIDAKIAALGPPIARRLEDPRARRRSNKGAR